MSNSNEIMVVGPFVECSDVVGRRRGEHPICEMLGFYPSVYPSSFDAHVDIEAVSKDERQKEKGITAAKIQRGTKTRNGYKARKEFWR